MKRHILSTVLSCAFLCSIAAIAQAQTETSPPPPAPVRSSSSSSSSHSGGPFGVGGIAYLSGVTGLSLAYDPGAWHIDTVLGISGGNNTRNVFEIGGRFWYHLANAGSADLSVGGGLAYNHTGSQGMAVPATSTLFIEVGALIRIFLTSNVALGTGAGFAIATIDGSGYTFGRNGAVNLIGNAAVHYFF